MFKVIEDRAKWTCRCMPLTLKLFKKIETETVSCLVVSDRLLWPWGSPGKNTGVDCHFLLQGIFLTQGSNPGLLHCRQILSLNHQGSLNCVRGCGQMFSLINFSVQKPVWYHWCIFLLSLADIDAVSHFYPNIQRRKNKNKTQNTKKNLDTIIGNWMLPNTVVF